MNARYLLGAVAVGLIVYSGIRLVIAQGEEEVYTTQKRNILYAIIGLAIVGLSGDVVRILNVYCPTSGPSAGMDFTGQPCTPGGFLNGPNAIINSTSLFNQYSQLVITFIKYMIGSVAVFMVIRSGLRLITSSGNEKLTEDKRSLFYGITGLIFIIMADPIINNVFYKINANSYSSTTGATPAIDTNQVVKEIAGATNLVLTIFAPIAVLMLLYGAFLYVTSAGNEETQGKAKQLYFCCCCGDPHHVRGFCYRKYGYFWKFSGRRSRNSNASKQLVSIKKQTQHLWENSHNFGKKCRSTKRKFLRF